MLEDELKHFLTLKVVLYTPDTMHNLLSISQVKKRGFWVRIGEDPGKLTRGRMDVMYRGSIVVKRYGPVTREGLNEEVAHERSKWIQATKTKLMDVWYQKLGPCD